MIECIKQIFIPSQNVDGEDVFKRNFQVTTDSFRVLEVARKFFVKASAAELISGYLREVLSSAESKTEISENITAPECEPKSAFANKIHRKTALKSKECRR